MSVSKVDLTEKLAALQPGLEYNCPSGDISKQDAGEYSAVYADEYMRLWYTLNSIGRASETIKLQEDQFSKHFPDIGPFNVHWKIGLWEAMKDTVVSTLPFFLRSHIKASCHTNKSKSPTLSEVLGKSAWSYFINVTVFVLPLFFLTVYEMLSPQAFQYKECFQIPGGGNATSTAVFTAACSSFPVDLYSKDYPSRPAASMSNPGAECTGISSGINSSTYVDTVYSQQYLIYVFLWGLTQYLSMLEGYEKILVRVSAGPGGIFVPCSDTQYNHATFFAKMNCSGAGIISIRSHSKLPWYVSSYSYRVQWSARLVELLALWFMVTLFMPEQIQEWYVFPTVDAEAAFIGTLQNIGDTETTKFGWCNSLDQPLELTYVKYSSPSISASILKALAFLQMCYAMVESQRALYDWINIGEYIDESNKDVCSYYDIHKKRSRIFSEPMLYDWLAVNFYYPIWHKILNDPNYVKLRKRVKRKNLEIAREALCSIHDKYIFTKTSVDVECAGTGL